MKLEIKNNRESTYNMIYELAYKALKAGTNEEFLERKGLLDVMLSRLADSHIASNGIQDYENTVKHINRTYEIASLFSFINIKKFIINDMIAFGQGLRMATWMNDKFSTSVDYHEVISHLHPELKLMLFAYKDAREYKWRNTLNGIMHLWQEFKLDEHESAEEYKMAVFKLAVFIFDNDMTNPYFKNTQKEMECFMSWLYSIQDWKKVNRKIFDGAFMVLIQKYTTSYFSFSNNKMFHIINKNKLPVLLKNNETWIRETKLLNDPNEQKAFASAIKRDDLMKDDVNHKYASFSLTTKDSPKETIFRYGNSYKNAVILEFDRSSLHNIIYTLVPLQNGPVKAFFSTGSLVGKVVYESYQIKSIWNKISKYLESVKDKNGENFFNEATIEAANVCKIFYKDRKWKKEREIRVVTNIDDRAICYKREDGYHKFKPSVLSSFSKIYSHMSNHEFVKKLVSDYPVIKESFEVSQDVIQHNNRSDKPDYEMLFADIEDF